MMIKELVKRIVLGKRYSTETFTKYLRSRGVRIGEDVIIGAGSVVTKDCQPNSVYAGNPARRISSIEDFINKRTALQNCEAVELVREYYHKYKQKPDKYAVGEYFMLFTNVDKCREFQSALDVCKNSDESIEYMRKHPAIYDSYDAFVEEALKK